MDEVDDDFPLDIIEGGPEDVGNEKQHKQLLDAISSLDGKKKHRLSQRTVLSNHVSEFNFGANKGWNSKVNLNELVGRLKETTSHSVLKGQLRTVHKKKLVVSEPLPKHEKQKIDRSVAYEKTSADVTKWDPIVHKNREADQLQFPLEKQDFRVVTTTEFSKRFQPRTPLEMQVAALLHGSDNVVKAPHKELTPAEQRALRAMDINEAKERRQELMKHRALLSYKETKAKWQKRIKSKRYHRILKKEKMKKEKNQLEELARTDPEEYIEKLKHVEKERVQERMSQKHRGGSKFARRQMIYAKYDDRAREQVQDMIRKNKELTQKLDTQSDAEEEMSEEEEIIFHGVEDEEVREMGSQGIKGSNPWMAKPSAVKPAKSKVTSNITVGDDSDEESDSDDMEEMAEDSDGEVIDSEDDGDLIDSDQTSSHAESDTRQKKNRTKGNKNEVDSSKKSKADSKSDKVTLDAIFDKLETIKETKMMKSEEKEKKMKQRKKNRKVAIVENKKAESSEENEEDEDKSEENLISEGLSRKRTLEDLEEMINKTESEASGDDEVQVEVKKKRKRRKKQKGKEENKTESKDPKEAYVDPNKLFKLESRISSQGNGPDIVGDEDDDGDIDPNEQQRLTIAQAFADDDVIEEFKEDKEDAIKKDKPKDIDLSLPGWGSWGGDGIVPKKKRKRFVIKAPPSLPRRDDHLGNVIINEDKSAAARKHQVKHIPFPYKNSDQFEQSISAPLGKTWNPEGAFKQLTKPKLVTHLGQVITPMDKSEVSKFQDKSTFKFKTDCDDTAPEGDKKKPGFKNKRNINKKHNKKRN